MLLKPCRSKNILDGTAAIWYNSLRCGSSSVVEHHLAKVGVASSNLVFRSNETLIPQFVTAGFFFIFERNDMHRFSYPFAKRSAIFSLFGRAPHAFPSGFSFLVLSMTRLNAVSASEILYAFFILTRISLKMAYPCRASFSFGNRTEKLLFPLSGKKP